MIQRWLSQVAWLGIEKERFGDATPVRILNVVSIMICIIIACHLPLAFIFWSSDSKLILLSCAIHFSAFIAVLLLSAKGLFVQARALLMISFIAFICCSSFLWPVVLNYHYFIIAGLIVSPFLYYPWESKLLIPNAIIYSSCFFLLSGASTYISFAESQKLMPYWPLKMAIEIMLLIAALMASFVLKVQSSYTLQRSFSENSKMTHLLRRVLPAPMGKSLLAAHGETRPDTLMQTQASVLFADIQGYSQFSQSVHSTTLVPLLDQLYCEIDKLAAQFCMEKIKTNGDQYIAVSGIWDNHNDYSLRCVQFAIALQKCFRDFCQRHQLFLALRIGVASGEVCAGIIGKSKLAFDVWGNTVNLAARLESSGNTDMVQICPETYRLIKGYFNCIQRAEIKLKGIGRISPIWITSEKTCID